MHIGHLHLLVDDVAAAIHFYQEKFDLTVVAEADFGILLRDEAGIDFVIGPAKDESQGQRMHFGFRQESQSAVKEKFDRLEAGGQAFVLPYTENESITLFALNDPDGNLIEVYFADGF